MHCELVRKERLMPALAELEDQVVIIKLRCKPTVRSATPKGGGGRRRHTERACYFTSQRLTRPPAPSRPDAANERPSDEKTTVRKSPFGRRSSV